MERLLVNFPHRDSFWFDCRLESSVPGVDVSSTSVKTWLSHSPWPRKSSNLGLLHILIISEPLSSLFPQYVGQWIEVFYVSSRKPSGHIVYCVEICYYLICLWSLLHKSQCWQNINVTGFVLQKIGQFNMLEIFLISTT